MSRMTNVPALDWTSMQDVFPPYRSVCGPGVAIDPRVPKKRMRVPPPSFLYAYHT